MVLYYCLCICIIVILLIVLFYRIFVYEKEIKRIPVRDSVKGGELNTAAPKSEIREAASGKLESGEAEENINIISNAINNSAKTFFESQEHPHEEHAEISYDVYRRLLLRHSILKNTINLVDNEVPLLDQKSQQGQCGTSASFNNKNYNNNRKYHLAVTDLFVEKAIAYLEKQAKDYKSKGTCFYNIAGGTVFFGMIVSILNYYSPMFTYFADAYEKHIGIINETFGKYPEVIKSALWNDLIYSMTRGFTMYGMIVLVAVGFWRYGKALLDQAERLHEKRHALRQGRLFVHLKDGQLTIDELDRAFNWNQTQPNAFGELKTEASAPLGNLANETLKTASDIVKSGLQIIKDKGEGEKGKDGKSVS